MIKNTKLQVCCLLFVIGISCGTSHASDSLLLAVEDNWPPYAKSDGSGISRSIIEKALAFSDTRAEFIVVPYARALKMAENGEVDGVFNVTRQASTMQKFVFGQEPLLQASASFYYAPGIRADYQDVSQIPDSTSIALIIGYEYGDMYERHRPRFREVRVSSQQQIIMLLRKKKVQMAIMFDQVARHTVNQMPLKQLPRKGQINHTSNIYLAFSPRAKQLENKIKLLDSGLQKLKQKPTQNP